MVTPADLDGVFRALADPTRRAMLKSLASRPRNISELAAPFDMTFTAASKHVRVLANAGLVRRKIKGRSHECKIRPMQLKEAYKWLQSFKEKWDEIDRRFD